MLRVAIIGMGPIGNRHADCYRAIPGCDVVGVCDRVAERADAASARTGAPAYYDAREMLDKAKPDICAVTTGGYEYASGHCVPTMQAIEAGCRVLGEKPISNDIAEAEEMVAAARKKACATESI